MVRKIMILLIYIKSYIPKPTKWCSQTNEMALKNHSQTNDY